MNNIEKYFDENGIVKPGVLSENPWLRLLTETDNIYVNAERIRSVSSISGRETVEYVMRTLDILDEICDDRNIHEIVSEVLKWSEVAKGGLESERSEWLERGYPLDIHNEASAMIYSTYMESGREDSKSSRENVIFSLIKTHGLIGQCIRGEIPVSHNKCLYELSQNTEELKDIDFEKLLMTLNECIVRAVSDDIWKEVSKDAHTLIRRILSGDMTEFSPKYRLEKLCPAEIDIFDEDAVFFENNVFNRFELWYFTSALACFDMGQIRTIFGKILEYFNLEDNEQSLSESGSISSISHLNFKPLADSLWYDYEGAKHINVYKKRIIEKYLLDASIQNVDLSIAVKNGSAFIDFKFSEVCEKLIDFCVAAERSGLLTFEKSIIVLYDMFGFRRDAFDRLNNEEKYLDTMNNVTTSTKDSIISHVTGETVVDVGSGGGILLDRLEQKYPDKTIIGTDISANVIDTLIQKKNKEGHNWDVKVHNFVEGTFEPEVDSIIFSSILHEIYSYTEGEKGRFDIDSVKNALKFAYDSLKPGGRIIIRDGIKTDSSETRRVTFKDRAGLDFFKNYMKDFKGLKDIPEDKRVIKIDEDGLTVSGDINFIREFMYTYTWGNESYAHEVQEQFGYFTLREYKNYMEELGAKIIKAEEFLEAGYPDNLGRYLILTDESGEEVEYPESNCIIVVEK